MLFLVVEIGDMMGLWKSNLGCDWPRIGCILRQKQSMIYHSLLQNALMKVKQFSPGFCSLLFIAGSSENQLQSGIKYFIICHSFCRLEAHGGLLVLIFATFSAILRLNCVF